MPASHGESGHVGSLSRARRVGLTESIAQVCHREFASAPTEAVIPRPWQLAVSPRICTDTVKSQQPEQLCQALVSSHSFSVQRSTVSGMGVGQQLLVRRRIDHEKSAVVVAGQRGVSNHLTRANP
jgi:hypothetical protein